MQTLSPTVFPCYAAADREIAAGIAAFLERGAGVRVFLEEGEIRPGEDLAAKAREARMADVVLVLFSRGSLPSPWPRSQWEDALVNEPKAEGVRIGFVKCDGCVPPRVLAPVFDCAALALKGLRELKRWICGRAPAYSPPDCPPYTGPAADLELLGIAIADRPGTGTAGSAALAFEFARAYREDFDGILRLECGGRTLTALAGDLSAQLGLRLEGGLEDNLERLRAFCSARRFLLLLDGAGAAPPHQLIFGGRCSTLIVAEPGPAASEPFRAIQHAFTHLDSTAGWAELSSLARLGRRLAREQGRIAECFELMQQWHAEAERLGDRSALNDSAREMVWILEGWGRIEEARRLEYQRATEFDEQMALPF